MRIPVERDSQGKDITPTKEEFLKKGSKRVPVPSADEGIGKDIQCTALISDLLLTAEELGSIKRMHWSIENRLHHVLDDTFREDRSPAKKSRNNLSLIICIQHLTPGNVRDRPDKYNDRNDGLLL